MSAAPALPPDTLPILAVVGFLVVLDGGGLLLFRLRRFVQTPPDSDTHVAPSLRAYMAPVVKRLASSFLWACGGWLGFYLALALSRLPGVDPSKYVHLFADLCMNVTSYSLLVFYCELSRANSGFHHEPPSLFVSPLGWFMAFAGIMVYELLTQFALPTPGAASAAHLFPFHLVYGLAQALALYLVTGRLEADTLTEQLRRATPHRSQLHWLHRFGVWCGYFFASIQPFYWYFADSRSLAVPVLVVASLVSVLWLMAWVDLLFDRPADPEMPSAIESYAYEMQRFSSEDSSSFERGFLRRHFAPEYLKRFRERKLGYIGLDYARINGFKRRWLGLPEAGLLVRAVSMDSDARKKGLRRGDLITSVNGMLMGESSHLSDALAGTQAGDEVLLECLREDRSSTRYRSVKCYQREYYKIKLGDFSKLVPVRRLRGASARIGWKFSHNSARHGVVCSWPDHGNRFGTITGIERRTNGQKFEVPDLRMLQMVMEWLIPGEVVLLHGRGLPNQAGDKPVEHRLKMAWEDADVGDTCLGLPRICFSEPTNLAPEHKRRLTKLHSDRLSKRMKNRGAVEIKQDTGFCRVLCFDALDRKVLEFVPCNATPVFEALRAMMVWQELGPEDLVVFAGRIDDVGGDEDGVPWFKAGAFAKLHLRNCVNRSPSFNP